jgi:hypothetical protein
VSFFNELVVSKYLAYFPELCGVGSRNKMMFGFVYKYDNLAFFFGNGGKPPSPVVTRFALLPEIIFDTIAGPFCILGCMVGLVF